MKKTAFRGLCILVLLLTGCWSSSNQQQTKSSTDTGRLKVGVANVIIAGSPPQGVVMLDKGILQNKLGQGYKIVPYTTRGIDRVSKELKEEKYDFIFCYWGTIAEYASNMSDYYNGDNYIAIANVANGPGDRLIAQPGIKNIKQLAGKTVGVFNHDYAGVVTLASTLKENGLDTVERGGTVKVRLGRSDRIVQDFKTGKLDAMMARASFMQPNISVLKDSNHMAYGGNPPLQTLLVRKGFLKDHPDIVEKVLLANIEATEWVKQNRSETADIVWNESEKFYKANQMEKLMPPKQAMAGVYKNMPVNVYPNLQFINDIWDYMNKYNPKKPVSVQNSVDFTLLNKALQAKGMPTVEEYNQQGYK